MKYFDNFPPVTEEKKTSFTERGTIDTPILHY